MYDYLVVGSGLYGAVFAHEAKSHGKTVLVIDKRPNIAGNIYTENIEGINVHKYGAHIFHTNNKKVWNYITQFAEFNRFTNSPVANYKRDLEANGDGSWLMRQFAAACERMERASGRNSYSTQRLQTVEMQIRELEEKLNKTVANQVEAMRMEALEKTAEAKHSLENGSIDDVPVDITNGISTVGLGTQWFCGEEINSDSEAAIYEELANDIRDRIADLKRERDALELEQGATAIARKNFDFFVRCLKALPETNFAGMKMNVNGLDVQGSLFRDMEGKAIAGKRSSARSGHIKITEEKLAAAPDYLNFEKGIYTAFIKSGVVKGDTVEYQTNFGVMLTTTGNSRNLSSFLGFRRANPDGTVMFLDEKWKVSGRSVCYTRKKLKDKRRVQSAVMTAEKRKKGEDMLRWIEQRSMGN